MEADVEKVNKGRCITGTCMRNNYAKTVEINVPMEDWGIIQGILTNGPAYSTIYWSENPFVNVLMTGARLFDPPSQANILPQKVCPHATGPIVLLHST